jgi:phenylalanyl-tRNA synthetase beta subunit
MATITLTIPDESLDRVRDKFAAYRGYQEMVTNPDYDPQDAQSQKLIENPVTKTQFLRAELVSFIRRSVRGQEESDAAIAARSSVQDVEGIV